MKNFAFHFVSILSDFANSEMTLLVASFAGDIALFFLKLALVPFIALLSVVSTVFYVLKETLVALQAVFWFISFYSFLRVDIQESISAENLLEFFLKTFRAGTQAASAELLSYPAGSMIIAASMAYLFRNLIASSLSHLRIKFEEMIESLFSL